MENTIVLINLMSDYLLDISILECFLLGYFYDVTEVSDLYIVLFEGVCSLLLGVILMFFPYASTACSRSWSHRCMGKILSVPLRLYTKYFIHVHMDHSVNSTRENPREKVTWKPELFLIFLIDRPPCTNRMRILGRWCSTPCTDSKETLD